MGDTDKLEVVADSRREVLTPGAKHRVNTGRGPPTFHDPQPHSSSPAHTMVNKWRLQSGLELLLSTCDAAVWYNTVNPGITMLQGSVEASVCRSVGMRDEVL